MELEFLSVVHGDDPNYGLGALGVPYRYIAAASLLFGPFYGFQARAAPVETGLVAS